MNTNAQTEVSSAARAPFDKDAQFLRTPHQELAEKQVFGDVYVLVRKLGQGGMGQCWLADEFVVRNGKQHTIRQVVIKIVPNEVQNSEEEMEKVCKTFQIMEGLHHTNICPVYGLKNDSVFGFYLIMKYIDGLPLHKYRRELKANNGKITLQDAVTVFKPLAEALDYAHQQKVIHRDIKPQNIILDKDGVPYLIDFGLAAQIHHSLTLVSKRQEVTGKSGTLVYMSPEQWLGERQKDQTDQYSLAVTVYEFLSGGVPFLSGNIELLERLVLSRPVPRLDFSESVNAALAKALAKERKERFKNCAAFIKVLEQIQEGIVTELPSTLVSDSDQSTEVYNCPFVNIFNAIFGGTDQDVTYLIDHGADVHARDNRGNTPLHCVAMGDSNVAVLQYLVDHGADVHAKNNDGKTPLHCAAECNSDIAVLQYLIDHGAEVHAKDGNGETPLDRAIASGSDTAVMQCLIDHGAYVNVIGNNGWTPLQWAVVCNSNVAVLQFLIDHGADIRATGYNGMTPLYCAAFKNTNVGVLQLLIDHGADVNAKTNDGVTPLHVAALLNSDVALQFLIDHGADVYAKDKDGKTPLDYADSEICEIIQKTMAQIKSN